MNRRFDRVAVLMGGPSAERDVSLRSGAAVARGLREAGYTVTEVDVTGNEIALPAGTEVVFLALHGDFGEDGQVQGKLNALKLPYTGSGADSSRASFDKVLSKKLFVDRGIPTPEFEVLRRGDRRGLNLPVVVKPACQGSSIGVHRIFEEGDWPGAVEDAFRFGDALVVETYVPGRELTVGLVDGEALPVIEICPPEGWYDYRAKYTSGASRYLVPAPLEPAQTSQLQDVARRTFEALGCRGMGRVDFRLDPTGRAYVLEMNTIPGFTETSLLPKAAACAGMSFPELCHRILQTAAIDGPGT